MVHAFNLDQKQVVVAALGLLEQEIVLPGVCYRDSAFDFTGGYRDTINVKRPARGTPTEDIGYRGAEKPTPGRNIKYNDITETTMPVKLDLYPGNGVKVTDEQAAMDIANFGSQVLRPQVRGMAEYFEKKIAAQINTDFVPAKGVKEISAQLAADSTGSARAVREAIIDARADMNKNGVPANGRFLLAGPTAEAILLKDPDFVAADFSGSTSALREAVIGRLGGFDIVVSNEIENVTSGAVIFAMHQTAMILATRAPVVPRGVPFGAGQSVAGIAARWIMDYDPDMLQDRSIISTFAGLKATVEDDGKIKRAVRIKLLPKA
ncbi:P22 phage major capsid protein family protein [Yinghuangia sp. YIM S09857]|uniref:P22 phage major capsid protein family protein n=1 Tax=Yinghuangia sp. YIM S09857 TaxID=3436929 RepID=UPI003F531593